MIGEKIRLYTNGKKLASLYEDGFIRDQNHKYLIYNKNPPSGFLSLAAEIIVSYYMPSVHNSIKNGRQKKGNLY